jgi:hypothetical protein
MPPRFLMRPQLNSGTLGGLMVIAALRRAWTDRRRFANARVVAESAFATAYPSKKLIRSMTSSFFADADCLVLQLCDDWGGIPPRRSFWLVTTGGVCRELTLDEAQLLKPLPAWR